MQKTLRQGDSFYAQCQGHFHWTMCAISHWIYRSASMLHKWNIHSWRRCDVGVKCQKVQVLVLTAWNQRSGMALIVYFFWNYIHSACTSLELMHFNRKKAQRKFIENMKKNMKNAILLWDHYIQTLKHDIEQILKSTNTHHYKQ